MVRTIWDNSNRVRYVGGEASSFTNTFYSRRLTHTRYTKLDKWRWAANNIHTYTRTINAYGTITMQCQVTNSYNKFHVSLARRMLRLTFIRDGWLQKRNVGVSKSNFILMTVFTRPALDSFGLYKSINQSVCNRIVRVDWLGSNLEAGVAQFWIYANSTDINFLQ